MKLARTTVNPAQIGRVPCIRGLRIPIATDRRFAHQRRTGPVEGHINRLKLIKRDMYGRAGFDLLCSRVLAAA